MAVINPAHITPPPATTPQEAERDKGRMGRTEADKEQPHPKPQGTQSDAPQGGDGTRAG